MNEDSVGEQLIVNKGELKGKIQAMKAEVFDLIKQIDIAQYTKNNKLQSIQQMEAQLEKLEKNGKQT